MRTAIIAILLLSTQLLAQQIQVVEPPAQCPLSIKDSPKLRGLKLGMSKSKVERSLKRSIDPIEIRSHFVEVYDPHADAGMIKVFTKEPIGQSIYSFFPKTKSENLRVEERAGGFSLAFFNDTLVEYVLYYDINEFASSADSSHPSGVVRKLHLPGQYRWTYGTFLNCREFRVSIRSYNDGIISVSVHDTEAVKQIDKRARESVRRNGRAEVSH